jgi:beta-glucosidase-like glycosyl hydrolase
MSTFHDSLVGQKLMWSFSGHTPPPDFLAAPAAGQVGGLTLFRALNLDRPARILELTSTLQRAARDAHQPRLLIGVDQEGGTLRLCRVPRAFRATRCSGVSWPRWASTSSALWGQLPCTGQLPVEVPEP